MGGASRTTTQRHPTQVNGLFHGKIEKLSTDTLVNEHARQSADAREGNSQ
jgi:hypothetical protein